MVHLLRGIGASLQTNGQRWMDGQTEMKVEIVNQSIPMYSY